MSLFYLSHNKVQFSICFRLYKKCHCKKLKSFKQYSTVVILNLLDFQILQYLINFDIVISQPRKMSIIISFFDIKTLFRLSVDQVFLTQVLPYPGSMVVNKRLFYKKENFNFLYENFQISDFHSQIMCINFKISNFPIFYALVA